MVEVGDGSAAEPSAREALVAAARRLDAAGLNVNASGNLSVRLPHGVLVTPSGVPPAEMMPADGVAVSLAGEPLDAHGRVPTSEWQLHVGIYRNRPEVGAIVHTHSPEATAAATLGAAIPAVHYAVARGDDLDAAAALALDVEWFCGVYRRARQLGEPIVLDDHEIERVAERFRSYGQPS